MSSSDKEPEDFWGSFKKGYNDQEIARKKDNAPLEQKLAEGAVDGLVETVAHPFRWLRSIVKPSK